MRNEPITSRLFFYDFEQEVSLNMYWWTHYSLFAAETVTLVIAIVVVLGCIIRARGAHRQHASDSVLEVKARKEHFEQHVEQLEEMRLTPHELKQHRKQQRKQQKAARKKDTSDQQAVWVLDFQGDLRASGCNELSEEISSLLMGAQKGDEVVVRLESGGGMVPAYGLAAAQLDRLREAGLTLTVCVDQVAASGGYMMACCADKLLAAPFAIIGSIGVVAQVPNLHRLLKKHDIDVEILTAGKHKRTMTMLGENTEEGRKKFLEDLDQTHDLFKQFVAERRPHVDIDAVSEGDIWYGRQAVTVGLIDDLQTSEGYLQTRMKTARVFEVSLTQPRSLLSRLTQRAEASMARVTTALSHRLLK